MTHTPGPWTLTTDERNTMFVHDAKGSLIFNTRRASMVGNARLIAAAPDLYNLAQAVATRTSTGIGNQELMRMARAALAKVTP